MLEISDFLGIIAFSISGAIVAIRKNLDILGVFISAFFTALGGGIIRDLLTFREIYAFNSYIPGVLVIGSVLIFTAFSLHKKDIENKIIFLFFDSLGLVSFSISGAIAGIEKGYNLFGVVLLSILTAVGGGMLRDILINEIPFFLKENFYATVSLIVALFLYFFGREYILVAFILGLILRYFAIKYNWHLPKI